jgi:hypothetical protein
MPGVSQRPSNSKAWRIPNSLSEVHATMPSPNQLIRDIWNNATLKPLWDDLTMDERRQLMADREDLWHIEEEMRDIIEARRQPVTTN